jgi:hypothetical protein
MGEWWYNSIFLDLSLTPLRLYTGEKTPGTVWIGAWVGPQIRSGRCGEEKNLVLPGIEPKASSPLPVVIPTPSPSLVATKV